MKTLSVKGPFTLLEIMILLAVMSVLFLLSPVSAYAGTVSEQPYGWAFPYWYDYSSGAKGQYHLEQPTLTGDDVVVTEDAEQTLNNKTLDHPDALNLEPVTLTYTTGLGYSITSDMDGAIFVVPLDDATAQGESDNCPAGIAASGTTVPLFEPGAADHGRIIGIVNGSSGGTPFVPHSGTTYVHTASGSTPPGLPDALNDVMWLQAVHGESIGWRRIGGYIQ